MHFWSSKNCAGVQKLTNYRYAPLSIRIVKCRLIIFYRKNDQWCLQPTAAKTQFVKTMFGNNSNQVSWSSTGLNIATGDENGQVEKFWDNFIQWTFCSWLFWMWGRDLQTRVVRPLPTSLSHFRRCKPIKISSLLVKKSKGFWGKEHCGSDEKLPVMRYIGVIRCRGGCSCIWLFWGTVVNGQLLSG